MHLSHPLWYFLLQVKHPQPSEPFPVCLGQFCPSPSFLTVFILMWAYFLLGSWAVWPPFHCPTFWCFSPEPLASVFSSLRWSDSMLVKWFTQCLPYTDHCWYCQVTLLFPGHLLWLWLLQYERVRCDLKMDRLRTWGLIVKGPLPDSFHQFFLFFKKRDVLHLFTFKFSFSLLLFLGWWLKFLKKIYVHVLENKRM